MLRTVTLLLVAAAFGAAYGSGISTSSIEPSPTLSDLAAAPLSVDADPTLVPAPKDSDSVDLLKMKEKKETPVAVSGAPITVSGAPTTVSGAPVKEGPKLPVKKDPFLGLKTKLSSLIKKPELPKVPELPALPELPTAVSGAPVTQVSGAPVKPEEKSKDVPNYIFDLKKAVGRKM